MLPHAIKKFFSDLKVKLENNTDTISDNLTDTLTSVSSTVNNAISALDTVSATTTSNYNMYKDGHIDTYGEAPRIKAGTPSALTAQWVSLISINPVDNTIIDKVVFHIDLVPDMLNPSPTSANPAFSFSFQSSTFTLTGPASTWGSISDTTNIVQFHPYLVAMAPPYLAYPNPGYPVQLNTGLAGSDIVGDKLRVEIEIKRPCMENGFAVWGWNHLGTGAQNMQVDIEYTCRTPL